MHKALVSLSLPDTSHQTVGSPSPPPVMGPWFSAPLVLLPASAMRAPHQGLLLHHLINLRMMLSVLSVYSYLTEAQRG